ncbi:unnamed protein product [Penicillium nalgiovense]|nr:unnamed protein product [Penicillium nalgiovense]
MFLAILSYMKVHSAGGYMYCGPWTEGLLQSVITLIMADAPVYNVSTPTGGDPLKVDVNAQYVGVEWNYTYIILCSFIVWLIIPGIGLLYSGLARRKSALALLFQAFMVVAVYVELFFDTHSSIVLTRKYPRITLQWIFWGYSLTYARDASPFIGTLRNFGLRCDGSTINWLGRSPRDRILLLSASILRVHAQEYRLHFTCETTHNTSLVFLGTALIWFGWFGFNGGSTLNASVRAMLAAFNTNTTACTGVLGWVLVDYIKHRGKFSVVGACEGAIAGLVGITPAAGFVSVWLAAVLGFLTSITCALLQDINEWLHIDEGMDVFKLHGIGRMVGAFLTGIFASQSIAALDGVTEATGGIDGNGVQVGKQLAEVCAISAYTFIVSCILLYILKFIPGMQLRVHEEVEMVGLDRSQFIDEQIGERVLLDDLGGSSSSVLDGIPVVGSQEKK